MRHWISALEDELSLRSAPDGFLSLLDRTELSTELLQAAVVSALVATRAERLAIVCLNVARSVIIRPSWAFRALDLLTSG